MATADQIKALIRSHFNHDEERFRATTLQIAATAAGKGHEKIAEDIRATLEAHRNPIQPAFLPGNSGEFLVQTRSSAKLAELVVRPELEVQITQMLHEHSNRNRLFDFGLTPTRKVLLEGPPGTGKTLTASVLAHQLELPLFTVKLSSLIGSYLGVTGQNLNSVFEAIRSFRGVYLFDEFDALATERGKVTDGEIRRTLNTLLILLDQDKSTSIVCATTNLLSAFDAALFRRFDTRWTFALPTREEALRLIKASLVRFDISGITWDTVVIPPKLSHSELQQACQNVAKDAVLRMVDGIGTETLQWALEARAAISVIV